jgi:hypothetical protein
MRYTYLLLKNIKINYYKPVFLKQKNNKYNSIEFFRSYVKFSQDFPNTKKNDRSLVIKRYIDFTPK